MDPVHGPLHNRIVQMLVIEIVQVSASSAFLNFFSHGSLRYTAFDGKIAPSSGTQHGLRV